MTDKTDAAPEPAEEAKPKRTLIPIRVLEQVPSDPPRFYVHADELHATIEGAERVLPLRIPMKFVEEIADMPPLEQLRILTELRGDEGYPEILDEMDFIDAQELAMKFFQAFHEKEAARLGESFSSSDT